MSDWVSEFSQSMTLESFHPFKCVGISSIERKKVNGKLTHRSLESFSSLEYF